MEHVQITANTKMADVIHLDYLLLPIVGRFGINLGFGNKTVNDVCSEHKINCSFFLDILNNYHNHNYFADDLFQEYPSTLIIEYLKNTHAYYLNVKIPEMEKMVETIIEQSSTENKVNNQLIANFFEEYKQELIRHLNHEEKDLFPYAYELERAIKSGIFQESTLEKIEKKTITHDDMDHSNLEEKLYDLKNLIIKFLPPVKRKDIMENLLIELFRLENDLKDHSRIEDKVLMPKIIYLEQIIVAHRVSK
jgi:regulator of cell morphogenesis and NO signaling